MRAAKTCIMISFLLTACTLTFCSSKPVKNDANRYGWIDNDTYRMQVIAEPSPGITDPAAKKESSLQNAITQACAKAEKLFISQDPFVQRDYEYYYPRTLEMRDIIKHGRCIRREWDDEGSCEIVFEIKAKGLKNRVAALE